MHVSVGGKPRIFRVKNPLVSVPALFETSLSLSKLFNSLNSRGILSSNFEIWIQGLLDRNTSLEKIELMAQITSDFISRENSLSLVIICSEWENILAKNLGLESTGFNLFFNLEHHLSD